MAHHPRAWLQPGVDPSRDHVLGPQDAPLTLVEFGSYACPFCRTAHEEVIGLRDRFGERMRYVFRQRPIAAPLARPAAELAETAADERTFWKAHDELMSRSKDLTEADLAAVQADLGLAPPDGAAAKRVDEDVASADASGVAITPTFFINGRRYEGAWDEAALADAMLGSLGHRMQVAALDFARWAPSTGVLLLAMSVIALALTQTRVGAAFLAFWQMPFGFALGDAAFRMSLLEWIDEFVLMIFFLVVGLEIKREFTVGRLASRRSAALPVAAALGGMAVPVALYLALIVGTPWHRGWGVPMPTDTAFAIAIIAALGRRVPVELRVFLTAASIVDDLGAITVVALFYSGELEWRSLALAVLVVGALAALNRSGIYRAGPYVLLGILLWVFVHAGGLHGTLTGVILAMLIPTRPPPNLRALMAQADSIINAEIHRGALRHGPSVRGLQALDAVHDQLESPASRMLRTIEPRSTYFVLPLFALANAGVVLSGDVVKGHEPLMLAIAVGLVIGKPVGLVGACWLAVRTGLAVKPDAYDWRQLAGAGALAGIGFTMSLFIAGQAFSVPADFAAAKLAVFGASIVSAIAGIALLWRPEPGER